MIRDHFVNHYKTIRNRIEDKGRAYQAELKRREAMISVEMAEKKKKTLDVVKQYADQMNRVVKRPSWRIILEEVSKKTGVSIDDMIGRERRSDIVSARHEAMWRMNKELGMSFPDIGKRLGGRDHTTAIHGVRKFEAMNANGVA